MQDLFGEKRTVRRFHLHTSIICLRCTFSACMASYWRQYRSICTSNAELYFQNASPQSMMTVFPRRVQWQPLVPNDSDSKACQGFMTLSRSMNLTETLHHPAWYQTTHRQPFTGGNRLLHIVSKRLCVESWQTPITGSLIFRLRYVHIALHYAFALEVQCRCPRHSTSAWSNERTRSAVWSPSLDKAIESVHRSPVKGELLDALA